MDKRKIAVIGVGKIAQDQHLPVIGKSHRFEVAATVSGRGIAHAGLPVFRTPAEFYAAMPEINLVAICTPPGVRHAYVRQALEAGCDVLMEKPPAPTVSELQDLVAFAAARDRVLFQTWHSRYNLAVDRARDILASHGVESVRIDWRERVRKWHPGQDWVWEPGGFGVFDPGINALSIFTKIMPFPIFVAEARLSFPSNRDTPVDAQIRFKTGADENPEMRAHFNWLEDSGEVWTITVNTRNGQTLALEKGGTMLKVDGRIEVEAPPEEYEAIYDRFAQLLDKRQSEVDGSPLLLVADAFLLGTRETTHPFEW